MSANEETLSTLGKLLAESVTSRDAVHIAVLPVSVAAGQRLKPGQRVGLTPDGKATAAEGVPAVGIVDPFMESHWEMNEHGSRFWLFMLPGTITGLRHQWTHPALESPTVQEVSRAWIAQFAMTELGMDFERLMDAADTWDYHEDYTYDNTERYKNVDHDKWPVFWKHYEVIKGPQDEYRKGKREDCPFTCSC